MSESPTYTPLSPDEYAALAHRTENTAYDHIAARLTTRNIRLLHGATGLCTETGEIQDILKRTIFYGKTFDPVHLQEELGDVLWYLALICNEMQWSIEHLMRQNIAKLQARYPEQFTDQRAVERNLTAERAILEDAAHTTDTESKRLNALRAIVARINGEWDQKDLVAFGPLATSTIEDVLAIANAAIKEEEQQT